MEEYPLSSRIWECTLYHEKTVEEGDEPGLLAWGDLDAW
jgi:hypothetical protein